MNLSISHLIFAILAISAEGEGECTEKMVVLGDSYSDTGNLISLTDGGIPPPPYFSGRFSNGKVWVEYLAELMKIDTPTPFYVEKNPGTNFAIAGARSGQEVSTTFFSDLTNEVITLPAKGLLVQTEDFLKAELSVQDSCASEYLFVIWVGAVDIFLLGTGRGTQYKKIIRNIKKSIQELIARAGATKFLVLNVPQFKKTPAAIGDYPSLFDTSPPRGLAKNVKEFNAGLKTMLDRTEKNENVKIIQADVLPLINKIARSPLDYGLDASSAVPRLDEKSLWLEEKVNYLNVKDTLWYDGAHPTTAVHEILAQKVYKLVKKSKKGSKSGSSTRTRRALKSKGTPRSQK